jgi:hypothetical protein
MIIMKGRVYYRNDFKMLFKIITKYYYCNTILMLLISFTYLLRQSL